MLISSKVFLRFFLVAGFILLPVTLLHAQSGAESSRPYYKITSWTTDDGLPGNAFIKIFQDVDGFLWMASFDGLVRFDGTRFITYNKTNLFTSNYAFAITGDSLGNLWIGADHGLIHYKKGKVTDLSTQDNNFIVESLFLDKSENKLWLGSRNAGLFTYDITTRKYELIDGSKKDDIINDILKDKDGSIWIGSEKNGLLQYSNKQWNRFTEKDGILSTEIKSINFDKQGTLYVGTTSGLFIRKPGEEFIEHPKFKGKRINKVAIDAKGKLWLGTVNGLYQRASENDWNYFSRADGLSNNDIRDIFFDADGSIWLGTYRGGVNQLRETKFANYFNEAQPIEAVGALCQLSESTLLVGTTEGKLFTIKNNEIVPYRIKTQIDQRIYYILQDKKKNLWIASYDGLLLITPDGSEKLFTEKDGLLTNQVRIIIQDSLQNYWIGTRNAGLIKMTIDNDPKRPHFEQYMHEKLSEVNSTFIMHLTEDSKGNILISSNNGGVTILSKDGSLTNYSKKNRLQSNTCFVSKVDNQGIIWVSTTDGLTRIKNGKVFTFTQKEGMPHENPMDIMEDDLGFFWLPTQKGTIRVNKQQLNDYIDKKISSIDWKLFDKNNDLERSECTGTARSLRTTDGKIWIPMIGGLMNVDPSNIQISKRSPRVFIEKVTIDDVEADIEKPIVVPAGNHRIAFDYLALTLRYPNSANYKYRLNGFDPDWISVGTDRQAVYTSLPYGEYSFSVMGCNNDGVWSESEATIIVIINPHFYQTWWFVTLVVVLLVGFVFIYIRIRTRVIKRESLYLEQQVKERTKMIAEQRDELVTLNEELRSSKEEVLAQRDTLAESIRELAEKNEEIAQMNANLEKIVEHRTKVLEEQNKRISKYSFINAHKLRAPLASILGLINLMTHEAFNERHLKLNEHLLKSANELDKVIQSIKRMLEAEFRDEELDEELNEDLNDTDEYKEETDELSD